MLFYDYGVKYSPLNSLQKHRPIREERIETQRSYDVPCVSLDAYCRDGAIAPHIIKIDAEVSEPEVLRGSSHIIAQHKPIISLEVWDDTARHSRENITFLLEQGFRGFEYHAGALIPHRLRDRYEYANVMLPPPDMV